MFAYDISNLTKKYENQDRPANDNINLQIKQGEIFILLGPNGAGKTTLIKQMANLIKPSNGSIKLFDKPLDCTPIYTSQQIGYMPQSGQALNDLTVSESLYFAAHLRGFSRSEALKEQERLLDLFNLKPIQKKVIARLSGGQKRLILLAMTMAASPKILILDEPTNDLDPQYRQLVWQILEDVNNKQNSTILFVSHNLVEAEKIAHQIGVIRDGQLIAVGKPATLKHQIAQQLHLEIVFPPNYPPQLPHYISCEQFTHGRWKLLIEKKDVVTYINYLAQNPHIEEFNLSTPTLEDLYLEMMKS